MQLLRLPFPLPQENLLCSVFTVFPEREDKMEPKFASFDPFRFLFLPETPQIVWVSGNVNNNHIHYALIWSTHALYVC